MCTVSWLRQTDGYLLLCNRDERHTRKPAAGPRAGERRGVSFIAPADGDHGGSWIGVNQFGLTLCLLNRYGDSQLVEGRTFTSRGLLLTGLLDGERAHQVYERVKAADLKQFRGFTMAIVTVDEPALVIDWMGRECLARPDADSRMPLTSSSLQEPEIGERRKAEFERMVSEAGTANAELGNAAGNAEMLWRFHRSHVPERGRTSVCMHREDAATVSLSAVTVTREMIEFVYHPGSPCEKALEERVLLSCQNHLR